MLKSGCEFAFTEHEGVCGSLFRLGVPSEIQSLLSMCSPVVVFRLVYRFIGTLHPRKSAVVAPLSAQ
jgi:hypothetical protein